MHPIEHLRYVARARGADPGSLVREAATALASLRADRGNLVIACRRIVERHPEVGPLWWMCARLLTADDPTMLAWEIADQIDDDPTSKQIAAAFDDGAVILTVGWPKVTGEAIMRRGNLSVLCADSRHEASGFMQRLERFDVECEPVPNEALARAAHLADLVVVEAAAASTQRDRTGRLPRARSRRRNGRHTGVAATGIGTRLPTEYLDVIGEHAIDASSWDGDLDDLPIGLVTHIASADGVTDDLARGLQSTCPFAPELLRFSPF